MFCQKLQSEFCYLASFRRRIDFCGVGAAGNWNKNHCSGRLEGHHFRLAQSPLWKHAKKNCGSNRCPETTHKVLMHLYQTATSFKSKKWNCAKIGANLNSKIVLTVLYILYCLVLMLTCNSLSFSFHLPSIKRFTELLSPLIHFIKLICSGAF